MVKHLPDSMRRLAIFVLISLVAPFVVNCFFAYPQTDDFVYSVNSRDTGFFTAQCDWYKNWTGRFTSTALLSVNPLVYDSLAGYRVLFAILIIAQFGSLYLLTQVLTKDALSRQEKTIFSLTLLFAFMDQMDDLRSGLYWMAGVITYQLAATLMILYFSLLLLIHQEERYDNWMSRSAVVALALILGGTNEIVLALTLTITTFLILHHYAVEKKVARFQIVTFIAAAIGSSLGVFAPGNFARMKSYGVAKTNIAIAWDAFSVSLDFMAKWATSPLVLILSAMVLFTVIRRPQLVAAFGKVKMIHSSCVLLFLTFLSVFIPYRCTGMYPQNRVINGIYFFFLVGWTVNFAVVSANVAEGALALSKKAWVPRCSFAAAAYLMVLFSLQSSNLALVAKDLLTGSSYRYSIEMQQKQAQIVRCADDDCIVKEVANTPYSLFFHFLDRDGKAWANRNYAAYLRKKSVSLAP